MGLRHAYATAALLALTVLAYLPVGRATFVYEDRTAVLETTINATAPIAPLRTRALTRLSYRLDKAIGHGEPWAFHSTNLVLHLVNGVLVLLLARRLGLSDTAAVGALALFLLHPMQSEAVAYIAGRTEVLSTALVLGALLVWLSTRASWRWPVTMALLILAMSAKESAIVGAGLVAWMSCWYHRERVPRRHLVWLGVLAGVGAALAVTVLTQEHVVAADADRLHYMEWQATALWQYVGYYVWPVGQSVDHDFTTIPLAVRMMFLVLTGAIAIAAAFCLAARQYCGEPLQLAACSVGWILIALGPRFLVRIPEVLNEHQLYLPSVALALCAGAIVGGFRYGDARA